MMKTRLQHSHIAIQMPFDAVAARLELEPERGIDDLGEFDFGDVNLRDEKNNLMQRFRFAQHRLDSMTHLLAENIHADDQIAFLLHLAGIRKADELSISRDQKGTEVRDKAKLYALISAWNRMGDKGRGNGDAGPTATQGLHLSASGEG